MDSQVTDFCLFLLFEGMLGICNDNVLLHELII